MADDATTTRPAPKRKARAKAAAKPPSSERRDAAAVEKGTDYVTLVQVADASGLGEAVAAGRVWIELPAQVRATRGDEGIKSTNRLPDGSVAPGTFKAVPASTWNADANNLIVGAETRTVNTFSKPGLLTNGHGPTEA